MTVGHDGEKGRSVQSTRSVWNRLHTLYTSMTCHAVQELRFPGSRGSMHVIELCNNETEKKSLKTRA